MDMASYCRHLYDACVRYQKTAPTVEDHCDDLYLRIRDSPAEVTLAELQGVSALWAEGSWLAPDAAANVISQLRACLGMVYRRSAGF